LAARCRRWRRDTCLRNNCWSGCRYPPPDRHRCRMRAPAPRRPQTGTCALSCLPILLSLGGKPITPLAAGKLARKERESGLSEGPLDVRKRGIGQILRELANYPVAHFLVAVLPDLAESLGIGRHYE